MCSGDLLLLNSVRRDLRAAPFESDRHVQLRCQRGFWNLPQPFCSCSHPLLAFSSDPSCRSHRPRRLGLREFCWCLEGWFGTSRPTREGCNPTGGPGVSHKPCWCPNLLRNLAKRPRGWPHSSRRKARTASRTTGSLAQDTAIATRSFRNHPNPSPENA